MHRHLRGYWAHDLSAKLRSWRPTPEGNYQPTGPLVWYPGDPCWRNRLADLLLRRHAGERPWGLR